MERYVGGEGFNDLVTGDFPEFKCSQFVSYIFRRSKLAGTYTTTFEAKELNVRETVEVPLIPEVISLELAQKVQARMEHRRVCNKEDFRKYVLTGYVRCGHCGRFLSGSLVKGKTYHRHHSNQAGSPLCVFYGIREDALVPRVLDYLFNFIFDEPSFTKAVASALPNPQERESLDLDRAELKSNISETGLQIRRLVDAVAKGVDPAVLIEKQNELREKLEREQTRLAELEEHLANMPSKEFVEHEAAMLRLRLLQKAWTRDWRALSYEEIRRYLIFVFGENPAKTENGILVKREGKTWIVSFKGRFSLQGGYPVMRPSSQAAQEEAERCDREREKLRKAAEKTVVNLKSDRASGAWRSNSRRPRTCVSMTENPHFRFIGVIEYELGGFR